MAKIRRIAVAVTVLAAGCNHPQVHPDLRDVSIVGIPSAAPDVVSSQVLNVPPPSEDRGDKPPENQGDKPLGSSDKPLAPSPGRLEIPPNLPGASTPSLNLPKLSGLPAEERQRIIQAHFPTLTPMNADPSPVLAENGQPLALADLEQVALANNPTIKQAAADVEAARGKMIQAGLLPNPDFGYQADQINSGNGVQTRGQQGFYFGWQYITAGKLSLARLAEGMAYLSAQVALKRAQIDVTAEVRRQYFAVLVARQSMSVTRALSQFSDEIYRAQLGLLQGGELAGYEPLQSYVLAVQARSTLIQAHNRYLSAWRQLTAAMGTPNMPPTEVAGRADAPAPEYTLEQLRETMLANHTEIQTAQNGVLEARYRLKLAAVTPIPDIKYQSYIERDWSTPPYNVQIGVQAYGSMPVFNRNQGGRLMAQAQLGRSIQEVTRTQNDLSGRLAQAWESYANSTMLVRYYRDQAIPNQVRVYRGTFQRYRQDDAKVNYNDVVVAQQTLAGLLNSYLTALAAQWDSVVNLAALSQQLELYPNGIPQTQGETLPELLNPMIPPPAKLPEKKE